MEPRVRRTRIRQGFTILLASTVLLFASNAPGLESSRWNVMGFLKNTTVLKDMSGFQYGKFIEDLELIQIRNTFKLDTSLNLRKDFHVAGNFDLTMEKMFASFQASYDAIYDTGDMGVEDPYRTGRYELGEYDLKFEYDLREIYLDLSLGPLWARLGRQIVGWGEMDGIRILDIVNPMDMSYQPFFQMPEEFIIPLYMARLVWTAPDMGPFTNTDLEFLLVPDSRPLLQAPPEAPYYQPFPIDIEEISKELGVDDILGKPLVLKTHEDVPASTFSNSEYGFRLSSLYDRLNFSLIYYYGIQDIPGGRLRNVDVTIKAGIGLTPEEIAALDTDDLLTFLPAVQSFAGSIDADVVVNIDMIHPFVNTAGFSFNYFEDRTSLTLRGEFAYTWQMAVVDLRELDLVNHVDRIDWGVGFDRNTFIHFLNKSSTFLTTLQFIGRHYQEPIPNAGTLFGVTIDPLNIIRRDSYMCNIICRTTYYHGLLIPTLFLGIDFGGMMIQNFMLQWIVNNSLSFIFAQQAAWGQEVGDAERDFLLTESSQLSLRIIYQF